jgi:hypothetical protein
LTRSTRLHHPRLLKADRLRTRDIRKGPLVVLRTPVENLEGAVLALRHHTRDTAGSHSTCDATRHLTETLTGIASQRCTGLGRRLRGLRLTECAGRALRLLRRAGWPSAPGTTKLLRTLLSLRGWDNLKVFARDRVLVLLAEKLLLDEHINGRRIRVGVLPHEETHGPRVLLAAEDQLVLLLPLRHRRPDRHRHTHQHGHYRQTHEQGRHRIAPVRPPAGPRRALVALT